jgi:hypothetical protein
VFPFGLSDGGLEFVAAGFVALDALLRVGSDSDFVEFVLFPDLSFDLRCTPWFSPWFRLSFVRLDNLFDCELDAVEVL